MISSAAKLEILDRAIIQKLYFDTKLGTFRLSFQFLRLSEELVFMALCGGTDFEGHHGKNNKRINNSMSGNIRRSYKYLHPLVRTFTIQIFDISHHYFSQLCLAFCPCKAK